MITQQRATDTGRFIIPKLCCPICGGENAFIAKSDKDKKPVMYCRDCKKYIACEYQKNEKRAHKHLIGIPLEKGPVSTRL